VKRRASAALVGLVLAAAASSASAGDDLDAAMSALAERWPALRDGDAALLEALAAYAGAREAVPASPQRHSPPTPAAVTTTGRAWPATGERLAAAADDTALRLRVAPASAVRAPAPGTVVFADQVDGLGHVLITAHGDAYHSVLAGMDRLDVGAGDAVSVGQPVGRMAADAENRLDLLVELRHNGRPVDPLPWLGTPSPGDEPS